MTSSYRKGQRDLMILSTKTKLDTFWCNRSLFTLNVIIYQEPIKQTRNI